MRMKPGLKTIRPVGLVLLITGLAFGVFETVPRRVAGAQAAGAYAGVAAADGVRVIYEIKGFVIVETFADGGGPTAQVSVSPIESVGFGAAPYPGDAALSAPGLASGATEAPVPDYPLIARSQYPSAEKASVDRGAVKLTSESTASSSKAKAVGGGDGGKDASVGMASASASSSHDERTGATTSAATSSVEAFSAGGVLRIGRVLATASVVDGATSDPKRTSELKVEGVTIAGQTVGLTPAGFVLPGTTVPLPATSPLLKALAEHGITVRYVAAEETATGVVAPGLEIRLEHGVPTAPHPGVAVFRFGRAAAFATGAGGSSQLGAPTEAIPSVPTSGFASGGTSAAPSMGAPAPLPATFEGSASPTMPAEPAMTSFDARPVSAMAVPQWDRSWTVASYLMIVLAGAIALGGAQLIRLLGVRMPWSS